LAPIPGHLWANLWANLWGISGPSLGLGRVKTLGRQEHV